jgi:hypothetical protein
MDFRKPLNRIILIVVLTAIVILIVYSARHC